MGGGKQAKNSGQLPLDCYKVLPHTLDDRGLEQREREETRIESDDLSTMTCAQLSCMGPGIKTCMVNIMPLEPHLNSQHMISYAYY